MNNKYPVSQLEERIGYEFKDKSLLKSALSHSSYVNELTVNKYPDYQRLEFLGDAVLELSVSDFLYKNKKEMHEGDMTQLRAALVCEPTLAFCAQEIHLSDFILLGKGEDAQGSRYHDSIVSDIFEALIGAIYLDAGDDGFAKAAGFINRFVITDMEKKRLFYDAKSNLQNYVQKRSVTLEYKLVEETGPEHNRRFAVAAWINGKEISKGMGSSKKAAEQRAAYEALVILNGEREK
ncbi:MAG: ribonuclease III [Lachnospiraceae bacterium]|nr:ribonuclease III [Lachnospiraceae bacterium]MCR5778719.1 ribonuclease III [Lachnospiraceae bacterium]